MSSVQIEVLKLISDARGRVFEPLAADLFPAQRNAHVVITEPGAVRGNHFHEHGTEVATVFGHTLVRWKENGSIGERVVDENAVVRFTLPPFVVHAFQALGDRPNLIVAFNTLAHDPANPDVKRDVLIEP